MPTPLNELTGPEFVAMARHAIEMNIRTDTGADEVERFKEEAKRRGRPWLYQQALNEADTSLGITVAPRATHQARPEAWLADYPQAQQYQLEEWVAGNSWHNPFTPDGKRGQDGECCPDFSCCAPEMRWDRPLREKFKDADDDTRRKMLATHLVQTLENEGHEVLQIAVRNDEETKSDD